MTHVGKKWTIAGILVFALVAILIANMTPGAPELSLKFEGYEVDSFGPTSNAVARFSLRNGSAKAIPYWAMTDVRGTDGTWSSERGYGFSGVPPDIGPRTNETVRFLPPDHPCEWRAWVRYDRSQRITYRIRYWLWSKNIKIAGYPDRSQIVTSEVLTNSTAR